MKPRKGEQTRQRFWNQRQKAKVDAEKSMTIGKSGGAPMDNSDSLLKSLDLDDTADAIRSIHLAGDSRKMAVESQLLVLLRHKNILIRNAAAVALRSMKSSDAVPILIDLIKDPENKGQRGTLIYALQEMDSRPAIIELVKAICEGDYEERQMALVALERMKRPPLREIEKARTLLISYIHRSRDRDFYGFSETAAILKKFKKHYKK